MPRPRRTRAAAGKQVEALRHEQDTRTNIPTAEYQPLVREEESNPFRAAYQRRNRDLDPQLVWRGKDEQDLADLVVNVPPLYIQEKVHPQVLIKDLMRTSGQWIGNSGEGLSTDHYPPATQIGFADLFADFNGLPEGADRTGFYQYDGYWQNRMILGDSLQVMASLAEREGLQGKVQCIYIDPPYGIRFNSNFQWSTTNRDVRDGNRQHITREPEQVKAFRDTWRDGIHSYLTYLRDRLTVARDLLADSGSIFVQIGDENVHRVRAVMDEVFGQGNFVTNIYFRKTGSHSDDNVGSALDVVLWYAKQRDSFKFQKLCSSEGLPPIDEKYYVNLLLPSGDRRQMTPDERMRRVSLPDSSIVFRYGPITGQGPSDRDEDIYFEGRTYPRKQNRHWSTHNAGMYRISKANRLLKIGNNLVGHQSLITGYRLRNLIRASAVLKRH